MCEAGSGEGRPGAGEPPCVDVSLAITVTDPEALLAYARERYAACWSDLEWRPADLAEAVLEALVISNENPGADQYGIEILDARAVPRERAG